MSLCPLKEQVFMSSPQVSGLVAMGMPQQKEACVWGPVAGRRGGQGKKREGALVLPNTLDLTLVGREKGNQVRDAEQSRIVCSHHAGLCLHAQNVT